MADINITVAISDTQGNTVNVMATSSTTEVDVITTGGISVTPQTAKVGTTRTFTFWADSSLSLALSAVISSDSPSTTFTPVVDPPAITGMPTGATVFAWTYVQ